MSKNDNAGNDANDGSDDREPGDFDDALMEREAREVYEELLERVGEAAPQPRLDATRRAAELLGDPQRAYPVIHITGTNGKTSTSRIIESILRAHGLRTGMLTSPHLERVNERIVIDGVLDVVVRQNIDIGHKIARTDLPSAAKVIKYGLAIGSVTTAVKAGEWIHLHNMKSDYISAHTRTVTGEGS